MDSNTLKSLLLSYLRFEKQVVMLATECGYFNSDVLCYHKGLLTEFEIKTSKQDLANDFKKEKHRFYLYNRGNINEHHKLFKPHRFCFVVPLELKFYALNKIENTPYGLICISNGKVLPEIKPRLIHNQKISYIVERHILYRMSSEITNLWEQKTGTGRHVKN